MSTTETCVPQPAGPDVYRGCVELLRGSVATRNTMRAMGVALATLTRGSLPTAKRGEASAARA